MSRQPPRRPPLLVSACLLGLRCRYDGAARPLPLLLDYASRGPVMPACPEQLGGLATPRPAAWIEPGADGDAVLDGRARVLALGPAGEEDRSAAFRRGAEETLALARLGGCRAALLKERSPSCGVWQLSCEGHVERGRGVTAALLSRAGLTLLGDEMPDLAVELERWYEADR
ncbi:MAG: DUF523 domain-containing protein [Candidatus Krumholzibacteriota bacterium]|nr:DUF523 domain-containing protein [Candidatus Krumholzibacteriota bacterium]